MPTLCDGRPAFARSLEPAIAFCARTGIRPSVLAGAALALSVGMGTALVLFPKERLALAAVAAFFPVRMALNAMGGALASRAGPSNPAGEVFDELADVLADAVLFLPLIFVSSASPVAVVLFAFLAGWSEFCGVLPKVGGFARRHDGPLGKSGRALAAGLYLVAVAAGVPRGAWETVFFSLLDALLVLTCANRLRKGLRR